MTNDASTAVAEIPNPTVALPAEWGKLMDFCNDLAKSDLVPKDLRGKPADIAIALTMGVQIGLHWSHALQSIAVINGRPSIWGDAALAVVMNHPHFEGIDENECSDTSGVCTLKRRGMPARRYEFTLEMARTAGLLGKDTYKQHQGRMLQRRARARAMADLFPDALKGVALADDAREPIDVTPTGREIEAEPPKQPKAKEVQARLAARHKTEPGAAQAPEAARPGADIPPTAESPARAAGPVDEATGELFTADQICERFAQAKTVEDVKEAADLARSLKNSDDQTRASNAYKAALKRLRGGE